MFSRDLDTPTKTKLISERAGHYANTGELLITRQRDESSQSTATTTVGEHTMPPVSIMPAYRAIPFTNAMGFAYFRAAKRRKCWPHDSFFAGSLANCILRFSISTFCAAQRQQYRRLITIMLAACQSSKEIFSLFSMLSSLARMRRCIITARKWASLNDGE